MQIEIENQKIEVWDKIFCSPMNNALISQVLNVYIDRSHTGSKKHKSRAEVAVGHRRLYMPNRKSSRGRRSAPSFRKGGVCFAARGNSSSKQINKKMYRQSLFILLSELYKRNKINFLDNFVITSGKTQEFPYRTEHKTLFLVGEQEFTDQLILATRNLHNVTILVSFLKEQIPANSPRIEHIKSTNPYDLAHHSCAKSIIYITKDYLKELEQLYISKY